MNFVRKAEKLSKSFPENGDNLTTREFILPNKCLGLGVTSDVEKGGADPFVATKEGAGTFVVAKEGVGTSDVAKECVGTSDVAKECVGTSDVAKECVGLSDVAKECVGSSGAVGFVHSEGLNLSRGSPNSDRCRFSLSKSPGWNFRKGVWFEFSLGNS